MDLRAFVTCGFWPVIAGEVADRALDQLGVARCLADAHVDHDLGQAGHLHDCSEPNCSRSAERSGRGNAT
jgi:hypothetical protein